MCAEVHCHSDVENIIYLIFNCLLLNLIIMAIVSLGAYV